MSEQNNVKILWLITSNLQYFNRKSQNSQKKQNVFRLISADFLRHQLSDLFTSLGWSTAVYMRTLLEQRAKRRCRIICKCLEGRKGGIRIIITKRQKMKIIKEARSSAITQCSNRVCPHCGVILYNGAQTRKYWNKTKKFEVWSTNSTLKTKTLQVIESSTSLT